MVGLPEHPASPLTAFLLDEALAVRLEYFRAQLIRGHAKRGRVPGLRYQEAEDLRLPLYDADKQAASRAAYQRLIGQGD